MLRQKIQSCQVDAKLARLSKFAYHSSRAQEEFPRERNGQVREFLFHVVNPGSLQAENTHGSIFGRGNKRIETAAGIGSELREERPCLFLREA